MKVTVGDPKRLLTGLVVAVVLGGVGGFALRLLAAPEKQAVQPLPPMRAMAPRMVIESVKGTAKVLMPSGQWRIAHEGDTVDRPTGLRTEGPDSSITAHGQGVRVVAQRSARVLIGAAVGSIAVQLDEGQALIHSSAGPVKLTAPANQATITGDVFAAWVRKDSMVIAVFDGEVALDTYDLSSKFAGGREITLNAQGTTPTVLAPQLRIEEPKIDKAGARYNVTAKTTPNAVVMVRRGTRYEQVPVGTSGTFTTWIENKLPEDGELVAYDSAGRRAQIDRLSETLDRVIATLSKNAPAAVEPTAAGTAASGASGAGSGAEPGPKTVEPVNEAAKPAAARPAPAPEPAKKVAPVTPPKPEPKPADEPLPMKKKKNARPSAPPPTAAGTEPAAGEAPKETAPSKKKGEHPKEIELEWGE